MTVLPTSTFNLCFRSFILYKKV